MYFLDTAKIRHVKSLGFSCPCKNHRFRFVLELDINGKLSETAIVIMKNPAKACRNNLCINKRITTGDRIDSDATVNSMIDKLYNFYGKIIILNLYPYMSSITRDVNTFYLSPHHQPIIRYSTLTNDYIITVMLKKHRNADIFCAWGQNSDLSLSEYAKRVYKFISLSNRRHYKLGEYDSKASSKPWKPLTTVFPTHGSRW